jgi:hypothetical protein
MQRAVQADFRENRLLARRLGRSFQDGGSRPILRIRFRT